MFSFMDAGSHREAGMAQLLRSKGSQLISENTKRKKPD
jgi:hypothetical protein